MTILQAFILGVIEGITEFLPVSSTGHLTIAENLMGFSINSHDITAFTAIIQSGAVLATVLYFRKDIVRIAVAWGRGIISSGERGTQDYRFGWAIILGSLPIGIAGLLFQDQIETTLRSLWFVAVALLAWSAVMWIADRAAKQTRHEKDTTWKDTLFIGTVQCLSLIPGVSRSGATMSAGLLRDFDRVTVTKLSFFLSIPALLAAGAQQTISEFDAVSNGVGWVPTLVATAVSFVVAYGAVAWLLKFIAKHTYSLFIIYRVIVAIILIALLASGTISAT